MDYIAPLSQVSNTEYIYLCAGIQGILEPGKFDCAVCLDDFQRHTDEQREMMLHKKRLIKGCFDCTTSTHLIGNLIFKTCPGNYQNSSVAFLWRLFSHYEKNLLPFKGTLRAQPNKVMEIFNIIRGLISEEEDKLKARQALADKMNKKLKKNGNG